MTTRHREHGGIDINPDHSSGSAASDGSGQGPRPARYVDDLIGGFDLGRFRHRLGEPAEQRRDEQRVVDLGGPRVDLSTILV